jgi:D-aminoacyl-tRNA deacylase
MILIVASQKDKASLNIKQKILRHYPFIETTHIFDQNPVYTALINNKKILLVTLAKETFTAQNLLEAFPNPCLVVFISRHSSTSCKPTLSVHTPGNFGLAELGGLPHSLSISPAVAMRDALKALMNYKEQLKLNYEVSYECTHHGPSLYAPTLFVELGSSETQWKDLEAAKVVAHAAMSSITNFRTTSSTAVLGIGGPHYNQKFTRMALEGEAIFGHMIPKYAISQINTELLLECIEKTLEPVSFALLDWKGIKSGDKPNLLAALQKVGLSHCKI